MSKQICDTQKVNRNNLIQIFRAFAIIAVVMIHTTPAGEWQIYCRPFINFPVATFLFLSGYLTKATNTNWCSFFKRRISRVIIPYFIWTLLYSLPSVKINGIEVLFRNLITAEACGTLYYIFVYIQFVLLTPILIKLANSKYRNIGWIITPISVLMFKYYPLLSGVDLNSILSLIWGNSCLGWFTFYYIGLVLGNRIIEKDYSLKTLWFLYIISIAIQIIEGYSWYIGGVVNCGTQIKLTSILTSTLFILCIYTILRQDKIRFENKFLQLLGDYSFGIYLCHIMIIWRIPYYTTIPYLINTVIVLSLSFISCYIGSKICGTKISGWLGLK